MTRTLVMCTYFHFIHNKPLSPSLPLFVSFYLSLSRTLSPTFFQSLSHSLLYSLPCLSKYTYIYLALWRAGINTESYFQCQQCEYKNKSKPIFHVPCVNRTSSKYHIYLYVYCICKENIQCVHYFSPGGKPAVC